jgi:hypothetical protein
MYVQVARYTLGTKSADDLVPKIEEGNLPVMREVPGFVEYYGLSRSSTSRPAMSSRGMSS